MTICRIRVWCASSLVLGLFVLGGCAGPRASEREPEPAAATDSADSTTTSTPALARRLVREEGALLLDARSAEEFAEGHVEGAVLIPHDQVAGRVDEIAGLLGGDRSKPVVVYCRSGNRSKVAAAALEQAGFTQVVDLGAMSNWCEDC